jgi:DNA mismatch endonuclease, patch repair protein
MASVGQRNTGPEMALRRSLHRLGLRYRLHDKKLPGSPDLVFPCFNAVMFVSGCFWHAHKHCKFATKPSSRKEFWNEKFQANRKRDKRNYEVLLERGWRVLIIWECSIKGRKLSELDEMGAQVKEWLTSERQFEEFNYLAKPQC